MTQSLAAKQKEFILNRPQEQENAFQDWKEVSYSYSPEDEEWGEKLLFEGKVACLLLAGGQGSRLGAPLKGAVQVTPCKQKSLFQIFCEKTFYAGKKYGRNLPLIVMTSTQNHKETFELFQKNNWFGLCDNQVFFFTQEDLPFCDDNGDWIRDPKGEVVKGPDGNGMALHLLYKSPIAEKLRLMGIEHIQMLQIDNPLADPFDAAFVGFHHRNEADISMIAVTKESETEKAGMLASEQGKLRVIEYIQKRENSLSYVNTGIYCFTFAFIEKIGKENNPLPWHIAYKKIEGEKYGWKFEYFIFDVFLYAKTFAVIIQPRNQCFSPLKNALGDKSLTLVQKDLIEKDKKIYKKIFHKEPLDLLELSYVFYYPTIKQKQLWANTSGPIGSYISLELLH